MNRSAHLLGSVNRSNQILEIGAGYTPVAPKSDGWRTHTVDHASQDELRLKYSVRETAVDLAKVDVDAIEVVDTVWIDGPLHQAVPTDLLGKVDLIIASHVLEHIPDIIGFFKSASHLVSPGGCISAAFPDRRYCFDCYKPWSTTGDLLDAHFRKLSRHSLKTAFNHLAYSASAGGQLGWKPGPVGLPTLMDPFRTAATVAASFANQSERPYQDYHAWQFTPAGFQLVMIEMAELGVSDWRVKHLASHDTFEFFVLLCRSGTSYTEPAELQRQRQELLVEQLIETREQIDFMLATNGRSERNRGTDGNALLQVVKAGKARTGASAAYRAAHPMAAFRRWMRGTRNI